MPDGLTVNTDELNRLAVNIARHAVGMDSKTAMIIRKAALDIERYAKQNAPVDTGFLRSSIVTEFRGQGFRLYEAQVRAEAEYSGYVEWGTSRMAPQPFMGPAIARVEPGYIAALATIVDPLATT